MFEFFKKEKPQVPQKKIISYDFGLVEYTKTGRSRRISLRVKPMGKITVSLPKNESFKNAEHFVLAKREWIQESTKKMLKYERINTIFDENSNFTTRKHRLQIVGELRENIQVRIKTGEILVKYPFHIPVSEISIQNGIKKGIEAALRIEAAEFLPFRLAQLAQIHGFTFSEVLIRNNKTVWGSCSSRKKISLSLHLMRLPDHLIDYILLHELSHTKEANHGAGFWSLLDKVSGNARGLDEEMKNFHLKYY